jgi:hypothetical protein
MDIPDVDTYRAFEFYIEEEFIELSGIELNASELSLEVGQEFILEAQVIPEDATKNKINWFSSNTSVAEVDSTGKVTATGDGLAAINAFTENYSFSATCMVTVENAVTFAHSFEINNNSNLSVFPNPCTIDVLKISTGIALIQELSIVTMEGVLVFKAVFNSNSAEVDVSELNPGSYIAIVRNGNKSSGKSFVIK